MQDVWITNEGSSKNKYSSYQGTIMRKKRFTDQAIHQNTICRFYDRPGRKWEGLGVCDDVIVI